MLVLSLYAYGREDEKILIVENTKTNTILTLTLEEMQRRRRAVIKVQGNAPDSFLFVILDAGESGHVRIGLEGDSHINFYRKKVWDRKHGLEQNEDEERGNK